MYLQCLKRPLICSMKKNSYIAALGDISFMGTCADKPSLSIMEQVKHVFAEADFVIGNLEGPLLQEGDPVKGKCTLRGHPDWARVLKDSGIGLVSLANNHMMDYGAKGLLSTMSALEQAGIFYVGAGRNQKEANAPLLISVNGRQIAILARTAIEVSSPSYASHNTPGVAFFYEDEIVTTIQKCAQEVDLVVMSIHWGLEQYHYPSPQQRRLAEKMIKAGARVIIGHHPHVLQGVEKISNGLVAYSLGNFLFDEFTWQADAVGQTRNIDFTLTQKNREGMVLKIKESGTDLNFEETFTLVNNSAEVIVDHQKERRKEFERFCRRLSTPFYNILWKLYAVRREWHLRISKQFGLRKLITKFYKIRPRHFVELIIALKRSSKVATGKSTNPYE